MDKCKWIDGVFNPCDDFLPGTRGDMEGNYYAICRVCNEDIRKPEPEKPLIVRSGNTWVAHNKGTDYLWIDKTNLLAKPGFYKFESVNCGIKDWWQCFSEIELTDKIALLRPMVFIDGNSYRKRIIDTLIYVDNKDQKVTAHGWTLPCRLATAKELS